jgi:hypothetical protein
VFHILCIIEFSAFDKYLITFIFARVNESALDKGSCNISRNFSTTLGSNNTFKVVLMFQFRSESISSTCHNTLKIAVSYLGTMSDSSGSVNTYE